MDVETYAKEHGLTLTVAQKQIDAKKDLGEEAAKELNLNVEEE